MPKLQAIWNSCEKSILEILEKDLGIILYLDNIDLKLEKNLVHYRFKHEYLK